MGVWGKPSGLADSPAPGYALGTGFPSLFLGYTLEICPPVLAWRKTPDTSFFQVVKRKWEHKGYRKVWKAKPGSDVTFVDINDKNSVN